MVIPSYLTIYMYIYTPTQTGYVTLSPVMSKYVNSLTQNFARKFCELYPTYNIHPFLSWFITKIPGKDVPIYVFVMF